MIRAPAIPISSTDTTSTGTGGDTGTGDSNTFTLDTTSTGTGGDTGTGDSNVRTGYHEYGTGGDTGTAIPIPSHSTLQVREPAAIQVQAIPIPSLLIPRVRVQGAIQVRGFQYLRSGYHEQGTGGDTGTGINTFALTLQAGTGGDTGTGDSNTFALDTTSTGQGAIRARRFIPSLWIPQVQEPGAIQVRAIPIPSHSIPQVQEPGDTGQAIPISSPSIPRVRVQAVIQAPAIPIPSHSIPQVQEPGAIQAPAFNTFALDTTSTGTGGDTGTGDSNTFALDTTSTGTAHTTGDSNTFALDTTSTGTGGDTGTGDSNTFVWIPRVQEPAVIRARRFQYLRLDTTSTGTGGIRVRAPIPLHSIPQIRTTDQNTSDGYAEIILVSGGDFASPFYEFNNSMENQSISPRNSTGDPPIYS